MSGRSSHVSTVRPCISTARDCRLNADMSPSRAVYRDAVLEAMGEKGASAEKMKSFYLGFNGYVAGILPRFDQFQIFVASRSPDGL